MRRILISLVTIAAVGGLAVGATRAFFNDTETSVGNTIRAGKLDLKIDSECHYFQDGQEVGCLGPEGVRFGNWESNDLTDQKFFNFLDVKPGDYGEDTLSLTVEDNDAWMCMNIGNAQDLENGITDPEVKAGDVTDPQGELGKNLHFTAWLDQGGIKGWQGKGEDPTEGDNKWDGPEKEPLLFTNEEGPASDVLNGKTYTFAESGMDPIKGGITNYIGLQWCAGSMTIGEGVINCDGSTMGNEAQTDSFSADLSFYAVQSRNNPDFKCSHVEWPNQQHEHRLILDNKDPKTWENINDNTSGILTWSGDGPEFNFNDTFEATGLEPDTSYSLIYAPDPWPQGIGDNQLDGHGTLSTLLGQGISDEGGNLTIHNSVNLNYDLPHPNDANFAEGAKIWLVLTGDYNGTQMTAWHPSEYLFENNLIHYTDTNKVD